VLKEYVQFVKKNLPKDASIARFKFGDEFIIVLNRDWKTSFEIIHSIQKKCKEKIFYDQQNLRSFTVSFSYGLTLFEQNIDTLATLLIKSEKSLKENKLFSLDKLPNNDHKVFEKFPFKELINN
jgi:GGDEF domain-containing protein